ncbi:MAG: DNA repair protein RadA [Gammaproteobacteria bacterium]|nr:DNA repair protein RadA [Gammaproteobacteria bacterium]MDH5692147.1 DNA repair protein RadA [Gammaproteobacteria bacterium]
MSKSKLIYNCRECGGQSPKWAGQCPDCGAWNSLEEAVSVSAKGARPRFSGYAGNVQNGSQVLNLSDIKHTQQDRLSTRLSELDRVLGGGLVHGAVTLIGGDPGIGKSTLLIQTTSSIGKERPVLYVTGEESLEQVSQRADRLGLDAHGVRMLAETRVESIMAHAQQERPQVMVIDSIQSIYTDAVQSAPGSVSQLRESAGQLVHFAKQSGTMIFLVGHVTKEGAIAGPRVLEHMVDTVLYFEGESDSRYRMIRAVKNRFGAVNELGVFAMTDKGLKEVSNPSAIFLSRHENPVAGSIITITREGSRPLLIELQALVDESHLANPRRVTLGLEQNRLAMLLAVLHRHGGIAMFDQDVYVNVVGGVRVGETGVDLAVIMAALSSFRNKPIPNDLAVFGEVGLAGEIRPVSGGEDRLREAVKHGIKRVLLPKANCPRKAWAECEIHAVSRLDEALRFL